MDVKSTWILTWHPMDHVLWSLGMDYLKNPSLGGMPNTNRADHDTPKSNNR